MSVFQIFWFQYPLEEQEKSGQIMNVTYRVEKDLSLKKFK